MEPLELVEVEPERVGQDRLHEVAVGDRRPHRVRAVLSSTAGVVAAYGGDRAGGHVGHRLPARERHAGRVALHRLPELLAGEVA